MKKHLNKILLIVITALGLFFRLYNLDNNPPSLNWDEVSHGYNAYSILKTGNDEWGSRFPFVFRAYGDYKLPVYIYLTTLPIALFGLTPFSIRCISVLSGIGLILLSYLIGKQLAQSNKQAIGLFSAFLCAVTPWSLFLSRVAVEANLAVFFFASGLLFLLIWTTRPSIKTLLLTLISWWLAVYSYNSSRIVVPLFLLFTFVVIIKNKLYRQLIIFIVISLIFSIPLVLQLKDNTASARYNLVSLLDQGVINQIEEKRRLSELPEPLIKYVYNRPTALVIKATENFLSNLSPKYLFFRGGTQYQFSFPDHELLYLVSAPFIIIGLYVLLRKKSVVSGLILLWLISAVIPSAVTKDAPHVLRTILILPLPIVLAGIGIYSIKEILSRHGSKLHGRLIVSVLVLAIIISFVRWWYDYQTIYPKAYSWSWQYGYREAIEFVKTNYDTYDKVYFSKRYGEPHEFMLFYLKYNPEKYQNDTNKKWDNHAGWYWVDSFDKFEFLNDWEVITTINKQQSTNNVRKTLLITSPSNTPDNFVKLQTINFLDDKPAFEIYESN